MKIRAAYETEICVTEAGYVKIEQPNPMGDEPSVVLLTADQLPHVIRELQALLDDRASWDYDQADHDAAADARTASTGAPS
jgi:hypothetical protein